VDQGTALQPSSVTGTTSTTQEGSNKVGLEEVVVTAQKREERLIDVPMSIVALGADTLEKQKISSIDDSAMAVPGLSIQESGGPYRQIYLRGVSNSTGNSSSVGLYLDEASVAPAFAIVQPDLRTYDLERIEVLRGPQGTLYGEGSLGGTIRFITNKPVLNQFAVTANVTTLFTEDGAPSQETAYSGSW
jgi:iron complex outermembrane receptor protein